MNVTPLIDVLLALLIIFLVILPQKPTGLDASVPQPPTDVAAPPLPPREIVINVHADRTLDINSQPVTWDALSGRLREILVRRPDGIFFVAAAPSLAFQDVARVIDESRGVGIDRMALVPRSK